MFKLTHKFSRMARIAVLLGLGLLAVTAFTSGLNNYYLTNVIVRYAKQLQVYKQYTAALQQGCLREEGFGGESSWDRYQDYYAYGPLPPDTRELTGEPRTHRM